MASMTPEQVRAARGWLGWSQKDLANRANVGLSTLKTFENGASKPIANNLAAIQKAIEAAGVTLTFDEAGNAVGITVGKWVAKL
jgi:ribosome-binding protein aMBF1 (putative translation factor)